jgi:hypothetical protein
MSAWREPTERTENRIESASVRDAYAGSTFDPDISKKFLKVLLEYLGRV